MNGELLAADKLVATICNLVKSSKYMREESARKAPASYPWAQWMPQAKK